jgi:hypothetical protein
LFCLFVFKYVCSQLRRHVLLGAPSEFSKGFTWQLKY